ncbi:hypothetical protein [uncultured Methylobacterium sp.]|uniref:LPS translocon maturation chaperone LptM n=1 Tax=uncultured Methylobacterium sp. TaxID=157278 RepID=UPI0035CB3E63
MPPRSRHLTTLAALGLVALAVSACGRRGSLEAPPGAAAPRPANSRAVAASAGTPTASVVQDGDELSPAAVAGGGFNTPLTTSRGAKRGYVIPREPFILDPLL